MSSYSVNPATINTAAAVPLPTVRARSAKPAPATISTVVTIPAPTVGPRSSSVSPATIDCSGVVPNPYRINNGSRAQRTSPTLVAQLKAKDARIAQLMAWVEEAVKVDRLRAGTIVAQTIILDTEAGNNLAVIASSNYDGTWDDSGLNFDSAAGFAIASSGEIDAWGGRFRGYIKATTGELVDLTISGTLTFGAAGVLRTAFFGQRIEIGGAAGVFDRVKFFTGLVAAGSAEGSIFGTYAGTLPYLSLESPATAALAYKAALWLLPGATDGAAYFALQGNLNPSADNKWALGPSNAWTYLRAYAIKDESGNEIIDLSAGTFTNPDNTRLVAGTTNIEFDTYEGAAFQARIVAAQGGNITIYDCDGHIRQRWVDGGVISLRLADETIAFRIDATGNDPVNVMVSGALHNVTEGAADSGGAGYKVLRVPN